MEFSAKRDDLSKVLSHVQSIVEKRAAIPVLSNVKITANGDNSIELLATDMDICIEDKIQAVVKNPICTTIPASTLYEIVRKISENVDVNFISQPEDKDSIKIQVGSSEFSLPTIKPEEFPSFEDPANTMRFSISSEILRSLFAKVRHAVSNEETRYYLNGVYLHVAISEDGIPVLRAVATDGHRLALSQTITPEGAADMPGIIVPKKAVAEVIKLLDSFVGEVDIALCANKIIFYIGSSVITSKLIDGKFPDYERVIPKNNDKNLSVSKKELVDAIELVISVSNDKTKAVKFVISGNKLMISATSEMNGNARGAQDVSIEFDSSESLEIGFNSRYVLDALSAIDGGVVKMTFSGNLGAVTTRDSEDNNFLYILMPMQV
ncbi:MAG: polymerase subunit beta [Candidatus Midichloriaceae bacterium]|jgi:DNA polymerase-3 subunit beta|nr:polymerase subunit beta [Candidatus Midichloriaceae bacterium]